MKSLIRIIRIGKTNYLPEIEKYVSKIKSIEILTHKEQKGSNSELIKLEEGKKMIETGIAHNIALSEEGNQLDSFSFAQLINRHADLTFFIGGPFGLSEEVKKNANYLLSLSKMTLPHELAFLVLVEQIYRAERILEGHPYHK